MLQDWLAADGEAADRKWTPLFSVFCRWKGWTDDGKKIWSLMTTKGWSSSRAIRNWLDPYYDELWLSFCLYLPEYHLWQVDYCICVVFLFISKPKVKFWKVINLLYLWMELKSLCAGTIWVLQNKIKSSSCTGEQKDWLQGDVQKIVSCLLLSLEELQHEIHCILIKNCTKIRQLLQDN